MVQHVSTSLIGHHHDKHICISRVQPDDDLLIRSKRVAPLNTNIPSCADGNCAITRTGL